MYAYTILSRRERRNGSVPRCPDTPFFGGNCSPGPSCRGRPLLITALPTVGRRGVARRCVGQTIHTWALLQCFLDMIRVVSVYGETRNMRSCQATPGIGASESLRLFRPSAPGFTINLLGKRSMASSCRCAKSL
jgi:hypothetical protein